MKRYLTFLSALLLSLALSAQSTPEEFAGRYQRLVERVGIGGVGVDTLLQRWEEAYPDDLAMELLEESGIKLRVYDPE